MNGCSFEQLEALARGELSPACAAEVEAHASACPRCARELGWLRAEQRLFAACASQESAPLPSFEDVLARSRGREPARRLGAAQPRQASVTPLRRVFHAAVMMVPAAAAAVAGLWLVPHESAEQASAKATADIVADLSYPADPPMSVAEDVLTTERAIATAENEYRACLLATPRHNAEAASARAESEGSSSEEMMCDVPACTMP